MPDRHQIKAVYGQIKAGIFGRVSLRSLIWLEIGHNLLNGYLSYIGGSSVKTKVITQIAHTPHRRG